jgi:hypothetical protein
LLLDLEEKGFSVVADVFGRREMDSLTAEVSAIVQTEGVRRRGEVYAIRNLLEICSAAKVLAERARHEGSLPIRSAKKIAMT